MEPKHSPEANGHIGIAAEVIIDLKGVGDSPQPRHGYAQAAGVCLIKGPVCQHRQGVGQNGLLGQPADKPPDAGGKVLHRLLPASDFRRHSLIADNGPGNQLGKQRHIQRHIQRVLLHLALSPIHIKNIGHGLKGEKGNANGQGDVSLRQPFPARQPVQVVNGEIQIFEHKEQGEVENHRQHNNPLPAPARGQQSKAVVHQDGEQHDKHKTGFSPRVEQQRGEQKKTVFEPPVKQIISRQRDRQKYI